MPATNNAMDPSDIPCDIRLTILEHLIEPSPLQPELQSRSKRLVDVLELRSTCRGWQEIVDEAFWKRWALRIGHGRFRYWTLDTDTVVEGTWEDTWRHMQENRVTRAFLDFPGARVTGEAMRKQGEWDLQVRWSEPAVSTLHPSRQGSDLRQEAMDLYGTNLLSSPSVQAIAISLGPFIPFLPGFGPIYIYDGDGLTVFDVYNAFWQWCQEPLTLEQQQRLWELYGSESLARLGNDPDSYSRTMIQAAREDFCSDYQYRRDLCDSLESVRWKGFSWVEKDLVMGLTWHDLPPDSTWVPSERGGPPDRSS